jgi:hypothetical protein
MPRIELERFEEIDDTAQSSTEIFDRIAFAQRALQLVRPPGTTVAICEGARRINVQAGRRWGGAEGERWAILSVPENASRRAITNAVLELGLALDRLGDRARPWALDVLMSGGA